MRQSQEVHDALNKLISDLTEGVSRNMRGDDARKVCPDIVLVTVPTKNEKADLTRYRDAGIYRHHRAVDWWSIMRSLFIIRNRSI